MVDGLVVGGLGIGELIELQLLHRLPAGGVQVNRADLFRIVVVANVVDLISALQEVVRVDAGVADGIVRVIAVRLGADPGGLQGLRVDKEEGAV